MQIFENVSWSTAAHCAVVAMVCLVATGCEPRQAQTIEDGAALYSNCVPCHGEDGLGKPDIEAPAIAGLGAWYIEAQLTKFQTGLRGAHPDDLAGLRMRPLSKSIRTDEQKKWVAAYVASLPSVKPEKTIEGGDPGRGGQLYQPCAACHGADASGSEALRAPALNHNYDWYLVKQLEHFKSGVRGAEQGDVTGAQMAGMVASLPDEQAMKDVVAYIQKLK